MGALGLLPILRLTRAIFIFGFRKATLNNAETPPTNKSENRERISMGAAASIDASAVPGIKEEYEKKMAEGE